MKGITFGFGGLVVALLMLAAVFVLSMRMKYRPVQDRVRQFGRAAGNRMVMKTAGQPGGPASVVRHVGRTSGAPYETPVGAVKTEDGFVIALPYGTSPDWFKNVRAAGSADLVHEGDTYQLKDPEIVSIDVGNPYFPPNVQRTHRLFAVDEFLVLRRVESP